MEPYSVLVVDDEEEIRDAIEIYLKNEGMRVIKAKDGIEAIEKLNEYTIHLIILDIMLPGKDGFEICKQIRLKKIIPILIVSAKKEDIDKVRALGLGADDFITKPFSPSELVARVKAHIARFERLTSSAEKAVEQIEVGGILIDKASRRVYVNQREVPFTTKEFDLLCLLTQNPDRVFSKEEIFEKIWGWNSVGDISTVTVHIRKIREKIERDPSNPVYIETVYGSGYRFKA